MISQILVAAKHLTSRRKYFLLDAYEHDCTKGFGVLHTHCT